MTDGLQDCPDCYDPRDRHGLIGAHCRTCQGARRIGTYAHIIHFEDGSVVAKPTDQSPWHVIRGTAGRYPRIGETGMAGEFFHLHRA